MEKMHARRKLKRHLKKRGEHFIESNPTTCKKWWHVLNDAVFDGKLSQPLEFHCRNFRDETLGWCKRVIVIDKDYDTSEHCEIGIRRELDDRKLFLSVLVHEMVHQWNAQFKITKMHHGVDFFAWKNRIYRVTGLQLSESY